MSSNFKELNLDRSRLKDSLDKFCQNNNIPKPEYSKVSTSTNRVKYDHDGGEVMVDFYFNKNGTTTINTKLGKHPDKGEILAIYLKNNLVNDDRKSVFVTVKNIDETVFETMLEFFQELKNEVRNQVRIGMREREEGSIKAWQKKSNTERPCALQV
jgi:hypothetical protein